jgi:hypothetical protein
VDYTSLIASKTTAGSIKNWVNYDLVDVEVCLLEAQALIYQNLRCREMRSVASLSISVGDAYKALPTDFLDPNGQLKSTKGEPFYLRTEAELTSMIVYDDDGNIESGLPQHFAIYDERINFDMKFDEARTLKWPYFKSPAVLAGGNPTNFLTNRYPHLLRTACLAMAADHMKDETEYRKHFEKLAAFIDRTNAESDLTYRGAQITTSI